MKFKQLTVLLILLLSLPLFLNCTSTAKADTTQTTPSLYFGVDVAFASLGVTEQLIDNVSSYTNFFVIGCTGNYNLTRLTIISQYVFDKGMSFIVYSDKPSYPSSQWLEDAKNNWGNSFLGIYYDDEEGGKQLDQTKYPIVTSADNYSDAANQYVSILNWWIRSGPYAVTQNFAYPTEFQLFTSDYALYWYDYEAGYNTVFAELGSNYSRQLNIALVRGAATVQNKDWGVILDWTYTQPPYLENGTELYNDMTLAYENGAKYIIVFDSNKNWTQNVLQQGQLDAMKEFWQYVQANPRTISPVSDRAAYVLPADYGYGFRGPEDKIWGLWSADSLTLDIGMSITTLFQMYPNSLDIVYPDGSRSIESVGYCNVIYWNDTRLIPNMPIIQSPSPILPPSTPSPTPQQETPLLSYPTTVYIYAIAAGILIAVAVAITVLKFRKRRDTPNQKASFPESDH
jgi:hypothetical protein